MSDENRDQETGATGFDAAPTVGSQLKAAREARHMSVGDIAMALKLGSKQVEALENGDWQSLPGQTFIRGFVRNYARLLQIDPVPLMGQLDAVLDSPQLRLTLPGQPQRQVTMPQAGRSRRRDYVMVWIGAVLVAVAAAVYFLLPEDLSEMRAGLDSVAALFSKQDEPAAPAPAEQSPKASQAEPVFPPGTTPQQVMNPQAVTPGDVAGPTAPAAISSPALVPPSVMQEPAVKPTPQPQQAPQPPQSAQPAAPAEKTAALHLAFQQDSWVEIRDGKGKVLHSQLHRAGTEQTIEGQGPYSLVLGNAPGVKVSLRGKPVDLAPRTQGNVARLTLE